MATQAAVLEAIAKSAELVGAAEIARVEAAFAQVPAYQAKLEKIQADMRHLARRTASMRERSARLAEGERARRGGGARLTYIRM